MSLLDRDDYEVHICEELLTDDRVFEEAYQQTYEVSCHSAEGRKVKFETSKISPMQRAIAVVDTWAEVQIIFPGIVVNFEIHLKVHFNIL